MKTLHRRFIAVISAVIGFAGTAAAQTVVVVGTGDPDVDVAAVQAAVNRGGDIVLQGRRSEERRVGKECRL